MINPRHISINEFDYNLPDSKIASYPLEQRDASQLLVYRDGQIQSSEFRKLYQFIDEKSLLVFNNTKVIRARLLFTKPSGARIEILCLEPFLPSDYSLAFQQTQKSVWCCMVGNAKRWKEPVLRRILVKDGKNILLEVKRAGKHDVGDLIEFSWNEPDLNFAQILDLAGDMPIPPYLNRNADAVDTERYQTVYSKIEGSVAAPTAGLHFTPQVFADLSAKHIETSELTLHVGAGTFLPVKATEIGQHEMHTEHFEVDKVFLQNLLNASRKVVAVGTTSVRTLESLYYLGIQVIKSDFSFHVGQWGAYECEEKISTSDSLIALIEYMDKKQLSRIQASTQIIIVPGFRFRIVDMLITNFHQPHSTLLLLVAAFVGQGWKEIYEFALHNNYRFLSYGDSSLLFRQNAIG